MVIHDKIALGTIAGLAGTIPQIVLDFISYQLGYAEYYSYQLAAGIHLAKPLVDTPLGILLGGILWELTGAIMGIFIVYFICQTGIDYWWVKGIILPNFIMFTIIYGFIFDMGGTKVIPLDIGTNFTELLGNTVFGLTTAYLAVRWGKESLR